ncbi:carbonic anhydrase family protein [Photobacterium japonica]|uniref:carbonic anhydrase n=1 Tax=Photobacterium japonica TaxID=2910235 RepID=UPI003D143AA1
MANKTRQAFALALLACSVSAAQAAEWSYEGKHGAEHWGETYTTCGQGVNQTPIDIRNPIDADIAPLTLDYQGTVTGVVNNGHTIQANVSGNNTLTVDNETFALKQFHFHTPSENYIDGKQYPLEVHFVHANSQGQLAVIGAMFDTGPRGNEAFTALLATIPQTDQTAALATPFNPADLLPRERDYYRFNGSLTTPPCSEGVRWYVMQETQAATKAQTDTLHKVMGNNARPLQPLNARVVLE